ncbi:MAG: hypothetical protein WBQ55_27480 [Xanthobacteraceae bacterium]
MSTNQTTRRAIIVGTAALPVLSIPAVAAADPIFAALERHRQAEAAYQAACMSEEIRDDDELLVELSDRSDGQYTVITKMTPTSVAGCAALLRHVEKYENFYGGGLGGNLGCDETKAACQALLSRIASVLEAEQDA